MKKLSIAVLTSGGFDSNVLLAQMLQEYREVTPIYIKAGLNWEKAELYWLKRYLNRIKNPRLKKLSILELPVHDLDHTGWAITGQKVPNEFSRDEEVYLPGRNLLLLSKAATFCAHHRIPTLAIGSLAANPFPDATPQFFRSFSQTASLALGFPIRVLAPFLKLKKGAVLRMGKNLPVELSFSCLAPRGLKPCKRCNKCAEMEKVEKRS